MKLQVQKSLNNELEEYKLLFNGKIDTLTNVTSDVGAYDLYTENDALFNELKQWSVRDFKKHNISYITYDCISKDDLFKVSASIYTGNEASPEISLLIYTIIKNWNRLYSIEDYTKEIECLCKDKIGFSDWGDDTLYGFILTIPFDNEANCGKLIDKITHMHSQLAKEAESLLIQKLNKSVLVTYFNFPKEYESACKQYLIYFTDFLRDLGINSESSISTLSENTIFSITPLDKNHALKTIKDILEIYLSLPFHSEISKIEVLDKDISVQQLISNIQHLKSQLILGNAIAQANNARIESLELTNYQLKQILKEKEQTNPKEGEDLIKGVVRLEKLEYKGITINLGELLRRLKRKII